jgi:1-acyl-sn-glycerol-3-phosphate acyltransferase
LLYSFLKVLSRLAIWIYCKRIVINDPSRLTEKGPLLIASNHPNSFLDSVILDTLFEQPVWSLARGDAFRKPFYKKILVSLKILPVYRTSEGVENLSENYKTFEDCIELFKKEGVVTIFSEGKCINEWHLRPLKKGTARLAIKAWEEDIPLRVLPVGINYSSFTRFGKTILLNFGDIISKDVINFNEADGLRNAAFNQKLESELRNLVLEIPKDDKALRKQQFMVYPSLPSRIILALPAILGFILHAPLFIPVKTFVWKRTHDNDHYDSVMIALLLLFYPLYLLVLVTFGILAFHSTYLLLLFLILPLTAWSFVQWRDGGK